MRFLLDPTVERRLRRATSSWRLLRLGELSALWMAATAGGALLLGILVLRGVVVRTLPAALAAAGLVAAALLGLLVVAVLAGIAERPRFWLAHRLEKAQPGLLDRLNTLVFLEPSRWSPAVAPYFERIEDQARDEVAREPYVAPFSRSRLARRWALASVMVLTAVGMYARYRPWTRLQPIEPPDAVAQAPESSAEAVVPPGASAEEKEAPWGEVRITEPGRDLRVTKVDVVALQIEAASNQSLNQALWFASPPDGKRRQHGLPPPPEPHYAAYQATLALDEYRLADWDVLSYYATASTRGGLSYASDIYFVEVRPFREDILKLPGGEGGKAYRLLNELSGLIDRQKHVIRETHGHLQRRYEQAEQATQDRDKLADAERELADASSHLYARIAAEMENAPVAAVLDGLAKSEDSLEQASQSVRRQQPGALGDEQAALTDLVSTRKGLQKAISENPGAFGDGARDDEDGPKPLELPDQLKRIAEFRHEEKAVKEALDELRARQRKVSEQAAARKGRQDKELAAEEETLSRALGDLAAQHPRPFKDAEDERQEAQRSLERAAASLSEGAPGAEREAQRAEADLQKVEQAVGGGSRSRGLAQAYRLRELLEDQAGELDRLASGKGGAEEARGAAEGARAATRELKRTIEETPAGDAFEPPLRQALSPERESARERALQALEDATSREGREAAAGTGSRLLKELTRAFDDSAPRVAREARRGNSLGEGEDEALDRAVRQIEGLVARPQGGTPEEEGRRRREALDTLRLALSGRHGGDRRAARLLVELEAALGRHDAPADRARLRELLDAIERFRVETSDARMAQADAQRLRHADVSRLPAAYRERIERYFRRLSEQ